MRGLNYLVCEKQENEFSLEKALFPRYFVNIGTDEDKLYAACNGWVMSSGTDFISHTEKLYTIRHVIVWSDCVKLRYGNKEEDSPWLWSYMKEYISMMAKSFDALRIDNAHSTPKHVAEKLIGYARESDPCIFIVAELFLSEEEEVVIKSIMD